MNTSLIKKLTSIYSLAAAGLLACHAQSGIWTNDASSVWSVGTNWLNGTVADGSGNTADFTLNNSNLDTVTLDSSRIIGTLLFGANAGTATNNWILGASGGSVLTLAGGTPTITVSNGFTTNIVVVTAPIAGTTGLTKTGNGTLVLGGTNIFSGVTAINAGTLQLTNIASTNAVSFPITPAPVLYLSFDSISNSTVMNQGTGGAAMNGTLGGTASIASGMGKYGNALSIAAGAATGGYVLINNAVAAMNVAVGSGWTVGMWLKSSTPGGEYFYQGNGGWASANSKFFLIQNAFDNDGNGAHAGGVSYGRSWEQGTAVVADGNWHFVVMTCNNGIISQYVDGTLDTMVENQWSGSAGTTTQVRIGGSPTSSDGEIGLNGLIDEVYMFTNGLSQAQIQTLMSFSSVASGPQQSVPLPAATTVGVAAPAVLDLNGDSSIISGLSGAGLVTTKTALGNPTLISSNSANTSFTGPITNSLGTLSLMKLGPGNLTLAGTNSYNGLTTVNGGTLTISGLSLNTGATIVDGGALNITGSIEPATTAATSSYMVVGNGVVNFSGAFLTNYDFNIGSTTNGAGAFYQTAGVMTESQGGSGAAFQLGSAQGGYGYYYIGSGASLLCGEIGVGGEVQPSGNGLMEVNGGTITDTGYVVVSRNGTGTGQSLVPQTGVVNIYSGSLRFGASANDPFSCNWGTAGTAIINVMGGVISNSTANNQPINLSENNGANTGILNLDGGLVQVGYITTAGTTPMTRVNFNGGTLAANENQGTMMSANISSVCVYANGGTFNNNGYNVTIAPQFLAPAGNGVNSIASFTGGAGYIAPPIVTVVSSDGNGVGATAIAQINPATGTVTNVVITCPGVNYTATPTFTLTGGGATTPATITGTTPTANTSGGMTFVGSGTTTWTGGSTYTGGTVVGGGAVSMTTTPGAPVTGGNLVVSNAILTVDVSSGTSLPANNVVLTNATLNLTLNPTAIGINATGSLTLQNTVTNNFNYGTVAANPSAAAVNLGGGISVVASGTVININAFGLKTGLVPLIRYTGATLSSGSFANIMLGSLPPGVTANLVNNPDEIDLNITGTGQNLSWYGLLPDGTDVSSNWDITLTTNWVSVGTTTPALRYQEYTSGSSTVGDPVTFDDTLYNNGTTPPPTNIFLATVVRPFTVLFNNGAEPYTLAGPGGVTGLGGILKSNTSTLTLLTSNSFSGGLGIYGGSVIITNDTALGTNTSALKLFGGTLQINNNTTNAVRPINVAANSTLDIVGNQVARYGGAVTGAGGLTKTDNGLLILAGTNGITGTLTVNQGTLTTLGTNALAAVPIIGNAAGFNGVLNIAGGFFNDQNKPAQVYNSSLTIGNVAGAAGDLVMSAGTLTIPQQLTVGPTSYGAFSQAGGATTIGGFIACGATSSGGVFNQSGGTVLMTNSSATIGYGVTTSFGVMNLSGSAAFNVTGVGNGVWPGEVGNGTLNVSGSATLTITNDGVSLGRGNAGGNGTVNLLGGTIAVNFITNGPGVGLFNFNGGTLKALSAASPFTKGAVNTAFNNYNGGAAIDDGGFAIAFNQPIQTPSGYGVATIPVVGGTSSGYIDTPVVLISGGNGSNAMATATVSGGAVTAVNVTCPGSGYLNGDSLSVSFIGGGANPTPPTLGTITFAANGAGGFTKKGSGTLTLSTGSSFGGPLAVNGGTLAINTATTVAGTITVTNGATLSVSQVGTGTESFGNLTLGVAASPAATLSLALASGNTASPFLTSATLTVNGSNNVSLAGRFTVGSFPLLKYSGAIAGTGSLTNVSLPQGVSGYVSNNAANSTIYAVITSTGPGLVWTGTNSNPALTNVWDIGSTTNWVLGTTPTTYQQSIPPGDSVTFNDVGEGLVTVSNTVSPFSLLISNNAVSYTLQGPGHLSGITGITKLGSGTATLNVTNNSQSGDTVISNGILAAAGTTALGNGGNLNIGPLGTLELAGFSETVNSLSGSGVIDNNSANSPILTFGAGGSGIWSGTMQDQGLGGGVSFIKNGNNTMIFNGSNYLSSANASQVNAGVLILTNNGIIACGSSEFWIAQGAGSTSTVVVASGTIATSNNWFVVGRAAATANGTLIVNGGTVLKAGANNIVVGSLGGTGTVIINGGQILNNSAFWLGENATADATLYLNGGLVQATVIQTSTTESATPASSVAYFNGGTLQATANSADFIQTPVLAEVMSNGLVLDDNGFTLSLVTETLLDGDGLGGGLIKKGSGTVYFDITEQYTGTTLVTNGTLAGGGGVTGPLVVAPTGNLGAGDAAGTGTFNAVNNVTLQGNTTLRINKTTGVTAQDQVVVGGNISYGGVLTVTNITSDGNLLTTSDSFPLFSVTGSHSGNFSSIAGSPGAGLAYSFSPASGILSIVTSTVATNPTNVTFSVSGKTLTLGWPEDHRGWYLQVQTNSLSAGLSNNWVDVPGSTTVTNEAVSIIPGNPAVFYRLSENP